MRNLNFQNNQRGSIQLPFLLIILVVFFLAVQIHLNMKSTYEQIKQANQHYLCLKEGIALTSQSVNNISSTNRLIQTLFYSQGLTIFGAPKLTLKIRRIIRGLQTYQEVQLVSYMKNVMTLKHCRIDQSFQFLVLHPYLRIGPSAQRRMVDKTLKRQRREKEWRFIFINYQYKNRFGLPYTNFLSIQHQDRFSSLSYHQ